VMGPVPALGEHRDAILDELGFDRSTVARWHKEEVV
jgi:crotonobetainyl-CoA:carnitine CoA-transferase CaiB-like acyl-CoA transferase